MKDTDLKWDRPTAFILPLTVREDSIDSYGHVNNAVYLKWIDDCARAHSLALGIDCEQAVDFGFGMAVRDSYAQYLAAALLDENLSIGTWITKNDERLRISREFQIIRSSDQLTLVRAQINYVCISLKTGKPTKMPVEFQRVYQTTTI